MATEKNLVHKQRPMDRRNQGLRRLPACLQAMLVLLVFLSGSAHARTYGVVVSGLGGEESYSQSFSAVTTTFHEALESLDSGQSIVLLDESANRETVLQAIEEQAALMSADSSFVLILTGHGTADSDTWKFNMTGPDLTTEDLVAALNAVPASRQLIVLAASASGAALSALSQPTRVVVTATKSGGEVNAVRFPEYLADAMRNDIADYDRNEILTISEAFRYARNRTVDYYEQQKLLASEHARLRGDEAGDMPVALLGSLKQAKDDPTVAAFLDERLLLEDAFKKLTSRKNELSIADYYAQLETLLISIAKLQQSIDAATGWSDPDAES